MNELKKEISLIFFNQLKLWLIKKKKIVVLYASKPNK